MAVRLGATDSVTTIDLGLVPFYWRTKPAPGPDGSGIPQRLPFAFAFDRGLQLVIQQRRPEVLDWLHVVYTRDANVGYLQEGHALAESYGNDFLNFFARTARPARTGAAIHSPRSAAAASTCSTGSALRATMWSASTRVP